VIFCECNVQFCALTVVDKELCCLLVLYVVVCTYVTVRVSADAATGRRLLGRCGHTEELNMNHCF
jgi:hypothetical protein